MELSETEKKVIEAMRKIPRKGLCRLCLTFEKGKVINRDFTLLERDKTD
jgi:hypothetical protein